MQKIFTSVFVSVVLFVVNANAQGVEHQGDIWYFNFNCGIDFSSGVPVSLNNSAMYTYEGCTSISDSNSNLLFYSDGLTVYNANHTAMVNGTGLHGGQSTSQACIAVRQPGSDSIWYLFTVASDGGADGAQYSIIDMSLQSGLGEVTVKNVPLTSGSVDEKCTATLQANGIDYWVLFHGYSNSTFYAYPLTSAGVGSVVTSIAGSTGGFYVGCMKFSPDGNMIAEAKYNLGAFQVFDFDKATGDVTYKLTFPLSVNFRSYGVEWSRDSRHLFMGNVDYYPGEVYEGDMTLPDTSSIVASATLVASAANELFGTLQMAPDGKIYMVRYSIFYLGVFNNPDSLGAATDYVANGFSTSPHNNYLGLPNYCSSWFNANVPPLPAPSFNSSDTDICEKFCINFFDSSQNNPTSWQWLFPGGIPSSSTDQNPANVCYNTPGIYDVTLITTNAGGSDTLTLSNYITVYTNPFAPVISQVGNTLTSTPATSYQWQFNSVDIPGATNQSYTISQSGLYTVIIGDDNGCTAQASVDASYVGIDEVGGDALVNVYPNPPADVLTVEFSYAEASANGFTISIVNAIGQQEVYSSEAFGGSLSFKRTIDVSSFAEGVYFITIQSEKYSLMKKVVILH